MSDAARTPAANKLPYWELVIMVASLMAMNAAAIDVFIPALQEMGKTLAVADPNQRQLVITAYILGFGGAQLVYGPLSDRFGRRPVLMVGLSIYMVATIAGAFSPTFTALLAFRLIQGIGAAATRVIAVSVVRDTFGGRRMASVMSLVMMVFMTVPVIAPNIGQAIMVFGNWREVFIVTGLFGLCVSLWAAIRLPETLHPEDRRELTVKRVAEAFRIVLTNRIAFGYTIATALVFGVLFGFINQAEQLYTEVYGLGPLFTLAFSATAVFMAAASFLNSRLVETFGMRKLSHGALVGFLVIACIHVAVAWSMGGAAPLWFFIVAMTLLFCLFGFIGANFNALAMDPLGHVAGTASSVLGFMQTFGGGIFGAIIGYFYDGTVIPMLIGFIILSLSALGCVMLAEGRLFESRNAPPPPRPNDVFSKSPAE